MQSVVADHAGTIAVESRAGGGATFIITLPKADRMSAKANILIVDDEANTLASLSRAFRLAGHEAVVCDNAARALELARSAALRPDPERRGDAAARRTGAA